MDRESRPGMVALQRTRQPVARLLRLIEMLTRHQITAEIEAMRANGTLPSQALLNLAIHNDWLSIHLQNLIVNRGPGANAPRPLSPVAQAQADYRTNRGGAYRATSD